MTRFKGAICLRHYLNDFLLRAGGHIGYSIWPSARSRGLATWALGEVLSHAAARGMDRLLITCHDDNVASARVIKRNGGLLPEHEGGQRFREHDRFAAQSQPHIAVTGVDVIEGEAADRGRPLGVKQHEQPGDSVVGFEGVVVQQSAGLVPAGFGVDDAGGAGPFGCGEVQAGQFLLFGPADEAAGLTAVGGLRVGKPRVEIWLPARSARARPGSAG
jgi:hypothetical protein